MGTLTCLSSVVKLLIFSIVLRDADVKIRSLLTNTSTNGLHPVLGEEVRTRVRMIRMRVRVRVIASERENDRSECVRVRVRVRASKSESDKRKGEGKAWFTSFLHVSCCNR